MKVRNKTSLENGYENKRSKNPDDNKHRTLFYSGPCRLVLLYDAKVTHTVFGR